MDPRQVCDRITLVNGRYDAQRAATSKIPTSNLLIEMAIDMQP